MNKQIWAAIQTRQKFSASVHRLVFKLQILSDKTDLMEYTELSLQLNQLSEDIKIFRDCSDAEIRSIRESLYS
jgi:hypothetical protein